MQRTVSVCVALVIPQPFACYQWRQRPIKTHRYSPWPKFSLQKAPCPLAQPPSLCCQHHDFIHALLRAASVHAFQMHRQPIISISNACAMQAQDAYIGAHSCCIQQTYTHRSHSSSPSTSSVQQALYSPTTTTAAAGNARAQATTNYPPSVPCCCCFPYTCCHRCAQPGPSPV